ncbi:hypothetical protein [Candidatus Magnetobacterium casense]|uniref:Uncharacterized protein n=1 Tax=Candidatus Magnetobacterium casense TaxID=1455061 RepID=A0ABS6S2Q1_9BACT|nr:hypothetical protein [Candidatus Magnetobacterium casensis]MBV6343125.1 hypothetical protein [Candidatus Magnetobacterium casensis]
MKLPNLNLDDIPIPDISDNDLVERVEMFKFFGHPATEPEGLSKNHKHTDDCPCEGERNGI